MKKVRPLKEKAKIAVISPSSGLPYLFPENYELGLENLRKALNFEILEMPTARMSPETLYQGLKILMKLLMILP